MAGGQCRLCAMMLPVVAFDMKKTLLFLLLAIGLLPSVVAQQIPYSGFDAFEADNLNKTGVTPVGWNASNIKRTVLGVTATGEMVFEDTGGRTGKCVRIENVNVGAAGITEAAPGWITLGKPWNYLDGIKTETATAGTDGGIKFSYRPDTIAVWVRRSTPSTENFHIVFYSWAGMAKGSKYAAKSGCTTTGEHTDEESDIRQKTDANSCGTTKYADQIAEAMWRDSRTYDNWTEIKVPIQYYNDLIPEKANIILSSANYPNFRDNNVVTGSKLWVDDLRLIYSSVAHEILLDNRAMRDFSADIHEYTVALGPLATEIPEITLKRSGRRLAASEYTVAPGPIGSPTTVTVRAEDGSSTTTYTITFVGEVSKNPRPAAISVGGTPIRDFQPYLATYDVVLPFGTMACPDIDVIPAEEGQVFSVNKPASLPGTATVTVTAPDGVTTMVYTLNLTVGALTDNTLTSISVDGKPLKDFSPGKTKYVVELPTGTTIVPEITYTTAYPDYHDIKVVDNGITGGVTISVTPYGTTDTRVYTLTFIITESTYSLLDDLKVGGVSLPGFDPERFDYSMSLPLGTDVLPAIEPVKGHELQRVEVKTGGLDGITTVTVTAESGKKSIYKITFSTVKSSVSTLAGIAVNGIPVEGFTPDRTTYAVVLTETATPIVTYEKGDDFQEITLMSGGLDGTTYIVVKAQDGTSTTYSLTFSVRQSSISTLSGILLDGEPLDGFDPDRTDYTIQLPRGTVSAPSVTWIKGDDAQTVRKSDGGLDGDTRITVRAQSGDITVYVIRFTVDVSDNSHLAALAVNGTPVPGFAPDRTDYEWILPSGSVEIPAVTWEKGDESQVVSVIYGAVTRINVRAESGALTVYTITFTIEKSENAFLEMIYFGGEPLAGFNPEQLVYDVAIPADYMACPTVSVDKAVGQQVTILAPRLTGTVRITVTPETGADNVYTIDVHYPRSDADMLMDLTLDGITISGFSPEVMEYDITLPYSSVSLPEIGWTPAHASQRVYVERGGIEGDTRITVAAESGKTRTYILHFSVARSSEAALAGIMVDGELLADFSPDRFEYKLMLPVSAVSAPSIDYVKGSGGGHVTMSVPAFEGEAVISVESADGSATATYRLVIEKTIDTATELSEIAVNGTPIPWERFVNDSVTLPWVEADGVPVVTCTPSTPYSTLLFADAGFGGTEIFVRAQDGGVRRYVVRFDMVEDTDATLDGIMLYNSETLEYVPLPDFDPAVREYTVELPWRTAVVPNIHPVTAAGQRVEIAYGRPNGVTVITVTAEDGIATSCYTLRFITQRSSDTSLAAIYVDGVYLNDFDPAVREYTLSVDPSTDCAPALTWETAVREQTVEYRPGTLYTPSVLTVTAEDGTVGEYKVGFEMEQALSDFLLAVNVGDTTVTIVPGITEYSVTLPYGTETMPAIGTICKTGSKGTIVTINNGLGRRSRVDAIGSDGRVSYYIDVQVESVDPMALRSLSIGGKPVDGFDPMASVYVVDVDKTPSADGVAYTVPNGVSVEIKEINVRRVVLETYVLGSAATPREYTVYFHYPSDIIPNATFNDWTTAKYNSGAKPVGWTVPADVCNSFTVTGTYYSGKEVSTLIAGENKAVKLSTIWKTGNMFGGEGNGFSIAGSIPGMMTLGNMAVTLASGGKSTSSVSGGIPFRNTPDKIYVDYLSAATERIDRWRMLVAVSDSIIVSETVFEGDFSDKVNWREASTDIKYGSVDVVKSINVTLNSAFSENADQLGGTGPSHYSSELHVDNLRFGYNNLLSQIMVDGKPIPEFVSGRFNYDYTLDSDYCGRPAITVTGQVPDQQHSVVWETDNLAIVSSKAEDGTDVKYMLQFNRPLSSENRIAGMSVGGVSLPDFKPDVTDYTFVIDRPFVTLPDVSVVAGSCRQTVDYRIEGTDLMIDVVAENGSARTYTVSFVTSKTDDVSLASLIVAGHPEIVFDAAVTDYTVNLSDEEVAAESLPAVVFARRSDLQGALLSVGDDTARVTVMASDGVASRTYTVDFVRPSIPVSAQLVSLGGVQDFAPDRFDYQYTPVAGEELRVDFSAGSPADTVCQTFTSDYVEITVKGDGSVSRYRITFVKNLSSSAALAGIDIDGSLMPGFVPELSEFRHSVSRYSAHTVRVNAPAEGVVDGSIGEDADGNAVFSIVATAADGVTSQRTTLTLAVERESSSALAAVKIGGAPLVADGDGFTASSDFAADIVEYDITLAAGTPKVCQPVYPDITVGGGAGGQTITMERGGIRGNTYVTVTSETGRQTVYTLAIAPELSAVTALADLAVDYVTVEGFDPSQTEYVIRTESASYRPVVTWQASDAYQTIIAEVKDDTTTIAVEAENGDIRTYTVRVERNVSSNAYLSSITHDGVQLAGFSFNRFNYAFSLPTGTSVTPEIAVVAGADGQRVSIMPGGVNGRTVIHVLAADGVTVREYNIDYTVKPSTLNTLGGILIGGKLMDDFYTDKRDYTVMLPVGTTIFPEVEALPGDTYQRVERTVAADGTVTLTVIPQDASCTATYTVHFEVMKSGNARLRSLDVDGMTIDGFVPDKFDYEYHLPVGVDRLPEVSWIKGDEWQSVEYVPATTIDGITSVGVIAGDGTTRALYTVRFRPTLSANDSLRAILLDGVPIDNFTSGVYEYHVELPEGTYILPEISYEAGDVYQTVDVVNGGVEGGYTITVTSQSGSVKRYVVHFTIEPSHNAALDAIYIRNKVIDGFAPDVYDYEVLLPYGTTELPPLFFSLSEPALQKVLYVFAESVQDTARIQVMAEDGVTTSEYRIAFIMEKSDNAFLADILIGSESLSVSAKSFEADSNFDPETYFYTVTFPYGTDTIPSISYRGQVDDYASVTLEVDTVVGRAVITVTSQDRMNINEYVVNYSIRKSDNVMLRSILLDGKQLTDYNPDMFDYTVTYPIGTDTASLPVADDVEFELMLPGQTVSVSQERPEEIVVAVTAEDGVTVGIYVIHFKIQLSGNSMLRDILVGGESITGFSPSHYEYTYLLYPGADIPKLEGVKAEDSQTITITMGAVDSPSYIYVDAADGSVSEYIITFRTTDRNPGEPPSMNDVAWTPIGDGNFQASSVRKNVTVMVYTVGGLRVRQEEVALIDPNSDIKYPHSGGTILRFDRLGQVYVYVFVCDGQLVKSGKFVY